MKKLLSILIAAVMAFSVATITTISALAAPSVSSPVTTPVVLTIVGQVNGKDSRDVNYSEKDGQVTFTYVGNGVLKGWEFPGLVEGKDYTIVGEYGNYITIKLIGDVKNVTGNAIVEFDDAEPTTEDKDDKTTTKKPSDDSKSPSTGIGMTAGLAMTGALAGAAVLTAMKKKQDAE